jgi:preprotein translocase subunit SecG
VTLLGFIDLVVLVLHVVVCVILVGIVLIQGGKGASLSASFGMGAAATAFGARTDSFMTKLTSGAAIAFVITSLGLTFLASRTGSLSQRIDISTPAGAVPEAVEAVVPSPPPQVEKPSTGENPPAGEDAAPRGN